MAINSQRWFMRKEDYEPQKTNSDSPFRNFDVKCLKCNSVRLTVTFHHDEQSGNSFVLFFCPRCRQHEKISVKF